MDTATTADSGAPSPAAGSSGEPSSPTGRPIESAPSEPKRRKPKRRRTAGRLFKFDRDLDRRWIAGADEAGRGCLAGPLVAAAVLFDYRSLTLSERRSLSRLDDSKLKAEETREQLFPVIMRCASRVAVVSRCVRGIDDRGLHVTNLQALRDALRAVAVRDCLCLIDGFGVPEFEHEQQAVIDGDARSAAIAASSVIAKVTRDRYMRKVAEQLPDWQFEKHVGYSTPEHRAAIEQYGISRLHRTSFQSIAYQQLAIDG